MGIKEFIKKKKLERSQTNAAKTIQRDKARAAYLREREKQEIETARWKAKQRGVAQRTVSKGPSTGGIMSFAQSYAKKTTGTKKKGNVSNNYFGSSSFGFASPYDKPKNKVVRRKKRRGKKSGKRIVVYV